MSCWWCFSDSGMRMARLFHCVSTELNQVRSPGGLLALSLSLSLYISFSFFLWKFISQEIGKRPLGWSMCSSAHDLSYTWKKRKENCISFPIFLSFSLSLSSPSFLSFGCWRTFITRLGSSFFVFHSFILFEFDFFSRSTLSVRFRVDPSVFWLFD